MTYTVSDFIVDRLFEWGVRRIYGYPGDGINGIMGALSRSTERIDFVQVPYVIAAKFAFPDRVAIALVGDGAMQMNGINCLITISKYWKEWSDPRLIVMVLNNHDLNMVTWEQRAFEGDPKFEGSQNLPDFSYAGYAESLGLKGTKVNLPEEIGTAWDEALNADRPVVLDVLSDPDVPPLPPHISLDQAKAYAAVLLKGDPNERGIIRQTFRKVLAGILPNDDSE
jgi:pyruvate dehydrogenase (quinone)